jgi:hypothetical protein
MLLAQLELSLRTLGVSIERLQAHRMARQDRERE